MTRNPIGFGIMKDVMWKVGKTDEGPGGLALEQASITSTLPLVRPRWERVKSGILDELGPGPKRASYFYKELAQQPDNKLCEAAYRQALLELEAEGEIDVLAKDGSDSIPKRRANTLGEDYFVRRAVKTSSTA